MRFNDKGIVECSECKGQRIVPSKEYPGAIMEVCTKCKGTGGQDWVEYAMGNNAEGNDALQYHVSYENIHRLMDLIREEGMKMNQEIIVTIKQNSMTDPFKTNCRMKI